MRKSVPFLLALTTLGPLAQAQDTPSAPTEAAAPAATAEAKPEEIKVAQAATPTAKPRPRPRPATTPAAATPTATPASGESPEATPKPKRPGFFQRLFGRRKPTTPMPVATPIPKATPKPRVKTRPRSTPASEANQPAANAEKPSVPPTSKKTGSKKAEQPPASEKTQEQLALDEATATGDAGAIEKAKYDEVKSRASADPKVKELKEKADSALTDDEGRKALRAYNKALFQKMRSLDSSIKDRVDQMEAAVMKRLQPAGE